MKKLVSLLLATVVAVTSVVIVCASSFKDVSDDAYYAEAAERMAREGILSGFGDGRYYGSLSVTRAQIAALVCKLLGKTKEAEALMGKTAFKDIPETSWCTGYVNYAVANKIIVGDGDGNFRPDDEVKFEEVVKVIVCVLDLDGEVEIDPADWSKEYIEVAEANGLIKNLLSKKGEPMLRSDIAVICDSAFTLLKQAEQTSEELSTTTAKKPTLRPVDDDDDDEATTTASTTTSTAEVTTTASATEQTTEITFPFFEENYDQTEGTAETTTSTTTANSRPPLGDDDYDKVNDSDRLPDVWFD